MNDWHANRFCCVSKLLACSQNFRMSLMWNAAAGILLSEIVIVGFFCINYISSRRWQQIFKLRIFTLLAPSAATAFYVTLIVLICLFGDSVMSMYKYSGHHDFQHPGAKYENHMHLFRSQRNFYISGCALFFLLIINRFTKLLSSHATLVASNAALESQAKNANEIAQQYMEQVDNGPNLDKDKEELQNEINELKKEIHKLKADHSALKSQSEGLAREYDRVVEELSKQGDSTSNKKDD